MTASTLSRLIILVVCLFLAGIIVLLFQTTAAEQRAREQAEATTRSLVMLRRSLSIGLETETGQRGYLLTLEPRYLEPYLRGQDTWLAAIDELRRSLSLTPEQAAKVDRIRELAREKLKEEADTIALAKQGRVEEAIAVVRSDAGKKIMDEIRNLTIALEEEEQTLVTQRLTEAAVIETRTWPILYLLVGGILVLVVIGFWLEKRSALAEMSAHEADALRAASERSDLLARELNHRVKNLFAVILSIVSLSGRGETNVKRAVEKISDRIHALSIAHAVSQGQLEAKTVPLADVVKATIEPYSESGAAISMDGPDVVLPVRAITPFGLFVHELATNAAKYGALSEEGGRLDISWSLDAEGAETKVRFLWWESSSRQVPEKAPLDGFGSLMMTQSARQLKGRGDRRWHESGIVAELVFPLSES
ncbi:CHASE3 domain-containing protein [Consotaella salsifontis]|uniref:histidine kinase n=1 Tax=Consotaella salsifontis TaxID=1365950 RepID=A0A1T4MBF1_9HYPH|nr:CHASE3 domain-containing protein [Consotaella salsifontis]SJZ64034.1 Two-component sensor histidine kinase, contains HisKA and HATPase domains [Consotaella salsifontis]